MLLSNAEFFLQKANDFDEKLKEEFKATNGWLMWWKERHLFIKYCVEQS
jgi:hypothetical protein